MREKSKRIRKPVLKNPTNSFNKYKEAFSLKGVIKAKLKREKSLGIVIHSDLTKSLQDKLVKLLV